VGPPWQARGDLTGKLLRLPDTEALRHFFVQEAFADPVGLDPFAVDHELRDGPLAGALDDFLGGSGRLFDIDVLEREVVPLQEALGFAAIGTPKGGIDDDLHAAM